MSKDLKYQEIAWAEMKPDTYGGESCDEIIPNWHGYFDGDMDGDDSEIFELNSKHFPPGTKIVISVPVCPDCGENSDYAMNNEYPNGTNFQKLKCDCGFDWSKWTYNQYC